MGKANQRAKVGVGVGERAGADTRHALGNFLLKRRLQGSGNEYARAVGADLTGAVKIRHHRDIGCQIEIGVIKDDQRRFATQFHGDIFQR